MDELLIDGTFPASRGYSGYRGDDGAVRDGCRVAGENSDARTATYGDDAAFISNFGVNPAHFSLPVSEISAFTNAWATTQRRHDEMRRLRREFYAAMKTSCAKSAPHECRMPA